MKDHLKKEEVHYKKLEKAALSITEAKLSKVLAKLAPSEHINSKSAFFSKLLVRGGMSLAVIASLGIGGIAGWGINQQKYNRTEAYYLNREELNLLEWAKSEEGQFARQIFLWNADLGDLSCQNKVKDLGVTIQIGTAKAISGYCWIWTVEPKQRKFIQSQ